MIELVEDKDKKSYMLNGKNIHHMFRKIINEDDTERNKRYMENQSELLEMEIQPLK